MDRLNQLRGEAGGSRDSSLDTSATPSEAYLTANESSKYFSMTEDDSSFDITPIKDVSLTSAASPDKEITGTDQLISNLSPTANKNDLLDGYKFGKQIEAANILSGGVDIFDDNDNSYDENQLVIDDNVVEIDEKSSYDLKLPEVEGLPFQKTEEITPQTIADSEAPQAIAEGEPPIESKDTEVVLQIDGKSINAIDLGNKLYLYRKEGGDELAAVQIVNDDKQPPSFKFLKVRENAEGNLEVYEEIQVEVPNNTPIKCGLRENDSAKAPAKKIDEIETKNVKDLAEPSKEMAGSSKNETSLSAAAEVKADKSYVQGELFTFNETIKSPVIHSTPNKEGIPLTKTMVDQQLHPNRNLDNVKTIEVHTDNNKQRPVDVTPKIKDLEYQGQKEESGRKIESIEITETAVKSDNVEGDKKQEDTLKQSVNAVDTINSEKDKNTLITEKVKEIPSDIHITHKESEHEKPTEKQEDIPNNKFKSSAIIPTENNENVSTEKLTVENVSNTLVTAPQLNNFEDSNKLVQNTKKDTAEVKHTTSQEKSGELNENNQLEKKEQELVDVESEKPVQGKCDPENSSKVDLIQVVKEGGQVNITADVKDTFVEKLQEKNLQPPPNSFEEHILDSKKNIETNQKQEAEINSLHKEFSEKPTTTMVSGVPTILRAVNKQKTETESKDLAEKKISSMGSVPPQVTTDNEKTIETKLKIQAKDKGVSEKVPILSENTKLSQNPKKHDIPIPARAIEITAPISPMFKQKDTVGSNAEKKKIDTKPMVVQQSSHCEPNSIPKTNLASANDTKLQVSTSCKQNPNVFNNTTTQKEAKTNKTNSQTIDQAKSGIKATTQKPLNNNHPTAVPFGKWTPANRQEFLNKIKESKVPATTSNTKQIKQPNDLNRRDVLQKIDSQRQSNYNSSKINEPSKPIIIDSQLIKHEVKAFSSKTIISQDSKVPVKTEVTKSQTKPVSTKPQTNFVGNEMPVKRESQKLKLPGQPLATSETPKTETPQRKELNNQDLIDRTIEGIINRAVSTKPVQDMKLQLNTQSKDISPTALDAIEKQMNELHGIPFVERPPHELPKIANYDLIKTYSRSDNQKASVKPNKMSNLLPFSAKSETINVKENPLDVDSEEEIIEHEPVTGDSDKNNIIMIKPSARAILQAESPITLAAVPEESKKEAIITEKDFDKFARRNSKTLENCLTVNFEPRDQPSAAQTMQEKDVNKKKISRNELLLAEAKFKSNQKHKSTLNLHGHQSKIQTIPKIVPVKDVEFNKNYPTKLKLAYQTALTTKRQMEPPITIIDDKPVKVVYMDSEPEYAPVRLNIQGQDLSPLKKSVKDADALTISTCDSLDSEILDSVDALEAKVPDDTKIKTKHQRKQILTPVEPPELELIEPSDLGIEISPKKRRKLEDPLFEKCSKSIVPKKTYLLGRSAPIDDVTTKDLTINPADGTMNQISVLMHQNTASAIDNLVKAAELLETQEEKNTNSPNSSATNNSVIIESPQLNTTVKRGRGRPRKYPLPEGAQSQEKSKVKSPPKKPRLIDAKRSKRQSSSDDDLDDVDSNSDMEMIKENWTMGKINQNIVCPICNKLFRSENVVFKHVKHCTGPSPSRSGSDKRSPRRRSRISYESDSKSGDSKSDDTMDEELSKKITPKKRKSKVSSSEGSTEKTDVIVIEDTPVKVKQRENQQPEKEPELRNAIKITQKSANLSCEICSKAFRQLSHLIKHKQQHKKNEQRKVENDSQGKNTVFSCDTCRKDFRKLHHLVQHRLIHNPSSIPLRSSRKSSFEHNIERVPKEPESSKPPEDPTAAFRCEPCDKSFRKLHHLVEHRETHDGINRQKTTTPQHSVDKSPSGPPPSPQCDICKKTFRKLHHLIEHKEQHVETNSLMSDDKSVKSGLSTKDIIHECSLCYMVFPNEHSLNKHTIICQRKKKQSAAKQTKFIESGESNEQEEQVSTPVEKNKVDVVDAPTKPNPIIVNEKVSDKRVEHQITPAGNAEQQNTSKIEVSEKNLIQDEAKQVLPSKRDTQQSTESNAKDKGDATPAKIIKSDEDGKQSKGITPKKKKVKEKTNSPVNKREKVATLRIMSEEKPTVKEPHVTSDDDEIRYMLNPDFKFDDKEEKFMKIRANKRSSLQIERPNSKDREINLIKRRTSVQNPPKIPRLKSKLQEIKNTISKNVRNVEIKNTNPRPKPVPAKTAFKAPKAEVAAPSTDSDDSEVKYSFPKSKIEKTEVETKHQVKKALDSKGKTLTLKRKSLTGIAKKKLISPAKQVRKRMTEIEHRCDCGQLFSSAALLSRHTSLAHTPPRIRKRRSPPPAGPTTLHPAAKTARKQRVR